MFLHRSSENMRPRVEQIHPAINKYKRQKQGLRCLLPDVSELWGQHQGKALTVRTPDKGNSSREQAHTPIKCVGDRHGVFVSVQATVARHRRFTGCEDGPNSGHLQTLDKLNVHIRTAPGSQPALDAE